MLIRDKFKNKNIILASQSPRRKELLQGLDVDFKIIVRSVDEIVPESINGEEIAIYLAKLKSDAFRDSDIAIDDIIITADTIVLIGDQLLGKPVDPKDAKRMLQLLSGNKHKVVTGVCIKTKNQLIKFHSTSEVYFKVLTDEEMDYYIDVYKPYDKAGSYGIQEWIGYTAIEKIEGSYFNVMGLPVQMLYEELLKLEI